MFGFIWSSGLIYAAHRVLPDQVEIDPTTGRVRPVQAAQHQLWLWTMDLNLHTQLGITPWMNVRLQFPLRFVQATAVFTNDTGQVLEGYKSVHHRNEILVGPGDPELRMGFQPIQMSSTQRWLLEFGGGLSFPLGRTEPDPYALGSQGKEHQHIMFGSGTFDPMAYLFVGYLHHRLQVYANFMLRGALYPNVHQFQEGIRFQGGLSLETSFGLRTWSFLLQTSVMVRRPGYWSGSPDKDPGSGRVDLLVTAGVFWRPNMFWQLSFQISKPINLALDGNEHGDSYSHPFIIGLGLDYRFRLF